jgi:hypothetical protein
LKQVLKPSAAGMQFTIGQVVPAASPSVQSGQRYGDEAVIFLSRSLGAAKPSPDLVLILHGGKVPFENFGREDIIAIVKQRQNQ